MEFTNPQEAEARAAARYRVFLILWIAMLMSLGIFLSLAVFVPGSGSPNQTMSYAFFGISMVLVIASLLIKQRQLRQAIEKPTFPKRIMCEQYRTSSLRSEI